MKVGIVGLGLIGGSMAKAIRANTDYTVYGNDIDKNIVMRAKVIEAINDELTDENIGECDFIIFALYPKDTVNALEVYSPYIKRGAYVTDCGGIKEYVCKEAKRYADKYEFHFVGGHPMAGIEKIGFDYSDADIFKNASMILTPHKSIQISVLEQFKAFFLKIGFGKATITTPWEHDEVIAYTSQLAHIISSAYIKSSTAKRHEGLSAGSFRDMSRVSYLNENMWTELFLENRNNLLAEISTLMDNLLRYKNALEWRDASLLKQLLADGRMIKENIDKSEK